MTSFRQTTRYVLLTAIVVCLVGCDQATKFYASQNLQDQPPRSYLNDFVRINYVHNEGAFLGLMGGLDDGIRFWVLTVANSVVLAWVGVYVLWSRKLDRWMFLALAMIVAGGIGNLIDRVRFGYVIDFMNLGFGDAKWQRTGIFNVADVAITAGFLMLLPILFRNDSEEAAGAPPAQA